MPHLLGKKSWNVYNTENIARVRRDEAEAKAREEEEQQRLQKIDAEKRIQILRGLRSPSISPPPPDQEKPTAPERRNKEREQDSRHRKRRRIAGEDAQRAEARREEDVVLLRQQSKDDAPLIDDSGHINLFPEPVAANSIDQYTMRFSNAAGFKKSLQEGPWYSSSTVDIAAQTADDMLPSKDVWGNEDPRRQERERARIDTSDPLAVMRRGVRQLRDVEREKKKWEEERKRELKALKDEVEWKERRESDRHRRETRRRRRRGSDASRDSLEGFTLDADIPSIGSGRDRERSRKHRRERRDRRDRSRERPSRHSRSHQDRNSHRSSRDRDRPQLKHSSADERLPGWVPAPGKRYSSQFAGL
ncbi:hypothetical protein ACJ72_03856 [Emergomyces africanus]|uniref:CBF1-interacting co-repressor CIR N-terminal domain-containing protein n=1 Tax=Emergomyces africanus TaxID=1955775 RepID=A0A1B7NYF5_9EURO|nr:hypothetical protein ACJ72_03856 [Emergomyces africanus]